MIPYHALGVKPGDDHETIRSAYRRFVIAHHPDHGGDGVTLQEGLNTFRQLMDKPAKIPGTVEIHRGGMFRGLEQWWDRRHRPPRVM